MMPVPNIRRMQLHDIPWLAQLIKESYGDIVDLRRCEDYFRRTLERSNHLYLRGNMSAAGVYFYLPWWAPEDAPPIASDLFFCAKQDRLAVFELVQVLREMVKWAKSAGCRGCTFGALNGADISGLAKRIGAEMPLSVFRANF